MNRLLTPFAALACAAALLLTHAPVQAKDPPDARRRVNIVHQLASRNNQFGLELMGKLHKEGENLFISPLSIASALEMCAGAAKGTTREEMLKTLHVDDLQLLDARKAMMDGHNSRKDFKLSVANSLWGNEGQLTLNAEYAAECKKYFDAEVRMLRFADSKTLDIINGWVSDKTNAKIPKLLSDISPDAMGYLINAVHFKGAWNEPFDAEITKDADFTLADKTKKTVKMMRRFERFPYQSTDDFQAVGIHFGEDRQAIMWFIVPKGDKKLGDVLGKFNMEALQMLVNTRSQRGSVQIPRFKMKYKRELGETLQALGIKQAFDADSADFSRFGENGGRGFFISRVIHEAVLEVNEAGAEAAAATAIEMKAGSAPPRDEPFEFKADRPFLVAIQDVPTGSILFAGAVYNPESE